MKNQHAARQEKTVKALVQNLILNPTDQLTKKKEVDSLPTKNRHAELHVKTEKVTQASLISSPIVQHTTAMEVNLQTINHFAAVHAKTVKVMQANRISNPTVQHTIVMQVNLPTISHFAVVQEKTVMAMQANQISNPTVQILRKKAADLVMKNLHEEEDQELKPDQRQASIVMINHVSTSRKNTVINHFGVNREMAKIRSLSKRMVSKNLHLEEDFQAELVQ